MGYISGKKFYDFVKKLDKEKFDSPVGDFAYDYMRSSNRRDAKVSFSEEIDRIFWEISMASGGNDVERAFLEVLDMFIKEINSEILGAIIKHKEEIDE